MDERYRIFVVDDDWMILELLKELLANYAVEVFPSANACLARLQETKPDMFMLDVSMPEIDGYTLCRRIKEDWETSDIPVLFISANDDLNTHLLCYEAGGDDFIVKPFEPNVLLKKVEVEARLSSEIRALSEQAGYAQRTAMSAMTSMGELGVVLEFLRRSYACSKESEIGEALMDAMRQYDLQATLQLRLGDEIYSISERGVNIPFEVDVLNHVRTSGRIFQFKSRCVFNYGRVTLMVNNMPVDDADKCGRIRDNGALLAEGADARLQAIEAERTSERRRLGALEILPRINDTLESIRANYRQNCFELTEIMIEYQEVLAKSFVTLGLTDGQEETLTQMAGDFMQRMVSTQDRSLGIVRELESTAGSLAELVRT